MRGAVEDVRVDIRFIENKRMRRVGGKDFLLSLRNLA